MQPGTKLTAAERRRLLAYLDRLNKQNEYDLAFFDEYIAFRVPGRFATAKRARHKSIGKAIEVIIAYLTERM